MLILVKIRKIPRGTFWIGGLASLALQIPLVTAGIYGLTHPVGWGARAHGLEHILSISAIFAGIPALLVGGGVARLAAHRLAERPEIGLAGSLRRAAVTMAVGGIGLALLAAVPLGVLPEHPARWWPVGVVGLVAGALTGLAIAVLAGMRQKRAAEATPSEAVA